MNVSGEGVVVLVPVLDRPHRVEPTILSVSKTAPKARVLFIPDPTDRPTRYEIRKHRADLLVPPADGLSYAQKINLGIEHSDEPWIFTGADDLLFHDGWLPVALALAESTGASVIGTNDLTNPRVIEGEHATHFLVARGYAELGTIDGHPGLCFEGYRHNYVDNELLATAIQRNAYAFAKAAHVEHLHPLGGKAPDDSTYRRGARTFAQDRRLHRQRAKLWA